MKNTFARLFVLALALTGFSAATITSHSQTKSTNVAAAKANCMPAPMCLPSSGGAGCW